MKNVTIYSTPGCVYCNMAKDWFKESNIPYTEHDVSMDSAKREEMIEKSGQMAVPVIDIEGDLVIGFDKEKLAQLLDIK